MRVSRALIRSHQHSDSTSALFPSAWTGRLSSTFAQPLHTPFRNFSNLHVSLVDPSHISNESSNLCDSLIRVELPISPIGKARLLACAGMSRGVDLGKLVNFGPLSIFDVPVYARTSVIKI